MRSEERLNIGTRQEVSGHARLHKYVVSEEQTITVPTSHEEIRVEREPITDVSALPADFGDQEQEVTLHADRVTVEKEMVPVERIRLIVDRVEDEQTVTETVRKERIEVEGLDRDDELR
ncbi:YsnF/AvaK domain-containing protein [Nocardia testacea]